MTKQRNFNIMGDNLIIIANRLLNNQNICKLLTDTSKTPLSAPDIEDTSILMNKNIRLVPKVPDEKTEKGSFIVVLLDDMTVVKENIETIIVSIRFDIICPMEDWLINEKSLRPFLIMSEISSMFNPLQINGIGKLRLMGSERIVMSDTYAGYSMIFNNYEFN